MTSAPPVPLGDVIDTLAYMTIVELEIIRDIINKLHPTSLPKPLPPPRSLEEIAMERRQMIAAILKDMRYSDNEPSDRRRQRR